jgi:hypothetical protein
MAVFVEFWELFANPDLSNQAVADAFPAEYTSDAWRTRASDGRRIFQAGAEVVLIRHAGRGGRNTGA